MSDGELAEFISSMSVEPEPEPEPELREGVPVADANGVERGVSREAARATVGRAVLLHSFLIPSCALLLPVVAMRGIAVRLLDPVMLPPAAIALTAAGVGVAVA